MPYNQANGTTDGLSWATWPDNSVRAVELEARAVEREARALEREAGADGPLRVPLSRISAPLRRP
jgi:hypothetical protein